jgi:hypothetical protein
MSSPTRVDTRVSPHPQAGSVHRVTPYELPLEDYQAALPDPLIGEAARMVKHLAASTADPSSVTNLVLKLPAGTRFVTLDGSVGR